MLYYNKTIPTPGIEINYPKFRKGCSADKHVCIDINTVNLTG